MEGVSLQQLEKVVQMLVRRRGIHLPHCRGRREHGFPALGILAECYRPYFGYRLCFEKASVVEHADHMRWLDLIDVTLPHPCLY